MDPSDIRSTEDQTLIKISFHCLDQCFCNAVRDFARVTFFQTIVAFTDRLSSCLQMPDKFISKRTSRHSHRALYDLDIRFLRLNVGSLVRVRSITLLCRHKSTCDLHTICAKSHHMINICPVKNPSRNDHRDLSVKFLFVFLFAFDDPADFFIKIQRIYICQLLPGKSKMSPCFRSFDHNKICCPVVSVCPHFEDQIRRTPGRNDWCDLRS